MFRFTGSSQVLLVAVRCAFPPVLCDSLVALRSHQHLAISGFFILGVLMCV